MNFFEGVGVGIGRLSFDAACGSDRIKVDQALPDRSTKRTAQKAFYVVVCALRSLTVVQIFVVVVTVDQHVKDSVNVRRSNLTELQVRDEVLDHGVIAFIARDGDR